MRTITSENDVDILKEELLRDGEGGSGSDGDSGSGSGSGSGDEPESTYIEIRYPLSGEKTIQHPINKCSSTAIATLSGILIKKSHCRMGGAEARQRFLFAVLRHWHLEARNYSFSLGCVLICAMRMTVSSHILLRRKKEKNL